MLDIYSEFNRNILFNLEFRKIQNVDLYKSKNRIIEEYHYLWSSANCQTRKLIKDYRFDDQLQFYLFLDMITYIPFENLGVDYVKEKLNDKFINVIKYRSDKIFEVFKYFNLEINKDLEANINYFFNNYNNDIFEINIITLAIISLRLFHRYALIMSFENNYASMLVHKRIKMILDQISNDVKNNNLNTININNYLPNFDNSNKLNKEMIEFLETCLDNEHFIDFFRYN